MLSCPHSDGNYLINNALYMSASSLCSHNMPSCSHVIFMCSYLYLIVCQRDKLFIVVSVTYFCNTFLALWGASGA